MAGRAVHARAASVLLDVLLAVWALSRQAADSLECEVFLIHAILDSSLICLAGLALVPGPIAGHACNRTALIASTDIRRLLDLHLRLLLGGISLLLFLWAGIGVLLVVGLLLDVDFLLVDLASSTTRSQAPAPARGDLREVVTLTLLELLVEFLGRRELDVDVSHEGVALSAFDAESLAILAAGDEEVALNLGLHPLLQTSLLGISVL